MVERGAGKHISEIRVCCESCSEELKSTVPLSTAKVERAKLEFIMRNYGKTNSLCSSCSVDIGICRYRTGLGYFEGF